MSKELVYSFELDGRKHEVNAKDVRDCFPSISCEGSYFFTLCDGTRFRGHNVKEILRQRTSLLRQ